MATVISLIPDENSTRAVQTYLTENASLIGKPKTKFHSTVLYTEAIPVFQRKELAARIKAILPIVLNPAEFGFDIFGEGMLALRYNDQRVKDINEKLLTEGLRQMITEWPDLNESEEEVLRNSSDRREGTLYEFNPHISLASGFTEDIARLPEFPYQLTLADISWKHVA